jgi:tryptophanyl-tRNA synthetase
MFIKLVAEKKDAQLMKEKYLSGGYGYGHAKKELLKLILEKYKNQRIEYFKLLNNKEEINKILEEGERKAKTIATNVLNRVKEKLGF